MANTIDQIDSYLKKHKSSLFANLNKWYGKNDTDAKMLKNIWNNAMDAKGINNKISAFNTLQEELSHWTDLEELERQEAELAERGEDNWTDPQARIEMDKMRFFGQLSDIPEIDKLSDLSIDDAFSQGYDFEQMRELAKDYGYDYNDKNERKEFLDKLAKYEQNKAIDKIWSDDLYTTFITPVAKEYARNNYENIEGVGDLAPALAADVGVNTLMAASPTKFGAQLYTAPVARAGANMVLNDRPLKDAAKEATAETLTNVATPYALKGFYRWGTRTKQGFEESAKQAVKEGAKDIQKAQRRVAQTTINESADKARDIQNKLKNGAAFNEGDKFYKFSKDGKKLEITDEAELSFRPVISQEDYSFYLKNKDLIRGKQWGPEAESTNANMERLPDILDDISKLNPDFKRMNENLKKYLESEVPKERKAKVIQKLRENIKTGKPATEGISAEDLALITGKEAKESKFNWAAAKVKEFGESDLGKMAADYATNLQGQTKYGGTMVNAVAQGIPFVKDKVNLEVEKKPDVKNDPELQLLERIYSLHKKYPNMVGKPKLPKQWEKDYTIEEIFGN
jgi:hypothetical protein